MTKRVRTNTIDGVSSSVAGEKRRIRCAIYTRKSSEEGLDQEFNSLDAQREAGEACIASQKNEGWICLAERYDDGGFSGGSMERPSLERLLRDIEAGKVDCVVVYKVDRLSRSLLDFARIMEAFDRKGVSFVSVTQQFNTTSSMGRLAVRLIARRCTSCSPTRSLRGRSSTRTRSTTASTRRSSNNHSLTGSSTRCTRPAARAASRSGTSMARSCGAFCGVSPATRR